MAELVIIGNGFDLAHGLKTSYHDFLRWLFELANKNPEKVSRLIKYRKRERINPENLFSEEHRKDIINYFDWHSTFLRPLFDKTLVHNWSDLEAQYFKQLIETSNPKKLNEDFNLIKEFLVEYLIIQQGNFTKLPNYEKIFEDIDSKTDRQLFLNFNYTKTVYEYTKELQNSDLIHIHGELHNPYNQIIFGYSANLSENRSLLEKGESSFLDNIKKYQYRRTNNKDRLDSFLRKPAAVININIIGHSCGISDAKILSDILEHPNINKIKIFFFNSFEDYQNKQVSIDRILRNHNTFDKILNYSQSERMPQYNDEL